MQSQVIGPGKCSIAFVALERAMPRVLSVVSRQFIRASKLPATAFPVTVIGLLTCNIRGAIKVRADWWYRQRKIQ